ncbi:MAG: dihydropyrimidinase [Firmicutes bacterium HGW-Firmicutes-16]|nr:MAG: dihydropyrimidinase [Firmicutes bacterium HGW-Firmicutes-16]
MKTLLKGGTLVSGEGALFQDVLIEDEKIIKTGENLSDSDAQIVDVRGKLLFPGFIDAHTHFNLEVAGTVTADDFVTGSRAALLGGTTTVIDFATQYHGESLNEAFAHWLTKAKDKSSCDYGFHMAISDWNGKISDEIQDMIDMGVTSFKLYMTYDDVMVNDKEIYQILKRLKEVGGITGVHCENSGVIKALVEDKKRLGHNETVFHPQTRPYQVEAEAMDRLLRIAELADSPIIVVHLTSKAGYEEALKARNRGQKVYLETCPQYLLLDQSLYELPLPESLKYVIAPPLRKVEDRDCLWAALAEDQIQTVSTDHCSFNMQQKLMGENDFTKIPGGMPGVEDRAVLLYTYGVKQGRITLPQMCRLLSENPAKLYGAYPCKGRIAVGGDADIVVFDPNASGVISAKTQAYNTDYAPYEGFETLGRVEQVYLRGLKVVDEHQVVLEHTGSFLKRDKFSL